VQNGSREVDPAELTRSGLTGQNSASDVADSLHHDAGVFGDPVAERHRRVGLRPALDRVELFDADRYTTEGFAHIRGLGSASWPAHGADMRKR
jgi:hypothetical protein